MATTTKKKPAETQAPIISSDLLQQPKNPTKKLIIALVGVSVLALFLFFIALHKSGALNGPEERFYQKVAKNDFMKSVFKSFHHPKYRESLTADDAVNVIQLRKDMMITANTVVENREAYDSDRRNKDRKISDLQKEISSLKAKLKTVEETTAVLTGGAPPAPAAVISTSPAAPSGALSVPAATAPAARAFTRALAARDFRKASKIIDAMPTEQAVDVLNALTEASDVVEILVLLKDKKAGEIIAALEPARGAEMLRMIMDRRGGA